LKENGLADNNKSGSRWLWALIAVVAVVSAVAAFSRRDSLHVRTTGLERGSIRSLISTNGKVEPLENFEAHAPNSTVVRRLLVKEGDHVRKGQLLLQLDDADVRSQAARAEAQRKSADADLSAVRKGGTQEETLTAESQLTKARADYNTSQRSLDSLRRLQQQGAASSGEVKQAEDNLQRAKADITLLEQKQKGRYAAPEVARVEAKRLEAQAAYDAAEDALAKSDVRAAFDGIVYALPVKQGGYVQAGDLLLQESDLSRVLVRAFIDEPDVGRLAPGQKIEVTWDAIPGRTWTGAVSAVPSTVKLRGARNVGEATCIVDNHDLKLLPNVNVNVAVITAEHANVLTLQREAVRMDDSQPYVYQVVDKELQRRDVQIALQNLTRVEITGGIPADAVVALSNTDPKPLRSGALVKIVP
jgi:HlyD family secretion protein